MTLENGTRLGPYEIIAPLGAGGMGEVYHARDTRLGRSVAIKVLPSEFGLNSRLRLRFEREARMISALNHPHICTLHDVGRENEIDYLVLEHCEGITLGRRIADGPLPIGQLLDYGMQIADALDKAHRQGIVHRDLKPSNVMLTRSGAKVLDFGLAKDGGDVTPRDSTIEQISEEGAIVGTVQYMAPEVLVGKEADARSDIFALGLILYEMATGKPAFSALSKAGLIAAILEHQPPPIDKLQPDTPPALVRLINACLVRDRDERMQSAHDVKLHLKWIAEGREGPVETRKAKWLVATTIVSLLLLAAAIAVMVVRRPAAESKTLRRLAINLPADAPLSGSAGGNLFAISPDGSRIVYVGQQGLHVRAFSSLTTTRIPGTEGAMAPFFSPDGAWVGYSTEHSLKKVALAGGSPVAICDGDRIRGATWGPDDTIVFTQIEKVLMRVSASGGVPEPLAGTPTSLRWPSFLPGTRDLLVTVYDGSGDPDRNDIALLTLPEGKLRTIVRGASHGQYSGGQLLYWRSRTVYSVPFDVRAGKITGPTKPLLDDASGFPQQGVVYLAVSGGRMYYLPYDPSIDQSELLWVDRRGQSIPVSDRRDGYRTARLSPDGAQIVTDICARGVCDLWRYEIERETWTRVTNDGHSASPIWSPDGRAIAYTSNRNGPYNLHIVPSDGSGPPRQITKGAGWPFPYSWSPNGELIAVHESTSVGGADLLFLRPDGSIAVRYLATPAFDTAGAFSPNGLWLAYQSGDDIFVRAVDGKGATWQISAGIARAPQWRGDGKEIFYRSQNKMMAVDITMTPKVLIGKPRILFEGVFAGFGFDPTRDGQRFLMTRQPQQAPRTQINVVEGLLEP